MGNIPSQCNLDLKVIMNYVDKDDIEVFSYIYDDLKNADFYYDYILKYNVLNQRGLNVFKYVFEGDYTNHTIRILELYSFNENLINTSYSQNKELFNRKLNIMIDCIAFDTSNLYFGGYYFFQFLLFDRKNKKNIKWYEDFIKKIIDRNPEILTRKNFYRKTMFSMMIEDKWFKLGYFCLKKYKIILDDNKEKNMIDVADNVLQDCDFSYKFQDFVINKNLSKNLKILYCCRSFLEDNILHDNYFPRDMFNLIICNVKTEKQKILCDITMKKLKMNIG